MMWTWNFWRQAIERSVKTAAQSVLLGLSFSEVGPVNAFELDWQLALGFTLGGAVLSILTSMASEPYKERGTPSMVGQD